MMYNYLIERNDGLTLIEVLITLVILSVGLLALAGLQISAIKGNSNSKRMTMAVSIAEKKIEQIKNTSYTSIQSEPAQQFVEGGISFTRQVNVADNNPFQNTKKIDVTVTWKDGSKSHTIPLSTIISQ